MRTEECCRHTHVPDFAESTRCAQHPRLDLQIKAIAGLDLDRGYTLGDEMIEAGQGARHQRIKARGARCSDGGEDAATRAGDLLIACASEAKLKFLRAIAAINEVGMAIDKARCDPASLAVDHFLC